jgi:polysaccharide pyruvyl transferase WcaK-like protein
MLEAPYLSEKRLSELDKFDAFLIGGGDLVNPRAVSDLYWRKEYLKKPTFVFGIGCPDIKTKESKAINYFREFFNHENLIYTCLRDKESMNYFNQVIKPRVPAITFPDAVCAMDLPKKVDSEDKILGVTLRSHRSVVGEYEQVRKAVNTAKEMGYTIKHVVMASGVLGEGDLEVTKRFAEQGEEIIYSDDLNELCEQISTCSMMLSMKFHGLIVAAMYGIPTLQMSSTQKNRNFFRYIQRPELIGNYQDENLYQKVPHYPVSIHSLLRTKLKRDARAGYASLKGAMKASLASK